MVSPMVVGAGLQLFGGIFGGKKKDKAAKAAAEQARLEGDRSIDYGRAGYAAAVNAVDEDQARALAYRHHDEERLKAATGVDLVKLVADAEKAGFNPLTVLNATGGAGYDGRGAVLTSPFISRSDALFRQADGMANVYANAMGVGATARQATVQTAGYVGDSVAGFGQNVFAMGQLRSQQNHESVLQANSFRDAAAARSAIYGGPAPTGKNGSAPPLVGAKSATGPAAAGFGSLGAWWEGYGTVPVAPAEMQQQPYSQQYVDHMGRVGYGINTDLMESKINWAWVTAQLGAQQFYGLARDAFNSGFGNTSRPGNVVPGGRISSGRNPRGAGAW